MPKLYNKGGNMSKEKEKTFEEELLELEEIVKKLESGEIPLDDAINQFTKAIEISKKCDEKLKKAEEAITKLVNKNGELEELTIEK